MLVPYRRRRSLDRLSIVTTGAILWVIQVHRACYLPVSGSSSAVERQLPKLDVAGSIPVARSTNSPGNRMLRDFDREPVLGRGLRQSTRHGPRAEHASLLQAQVEVRTGSPMVMQHECRPGRLAHIPSMPRLHDVNDMASWPAA